MQYVLNKIQLLHKCICVYVHIIVLSIQVLLSRLQFPLLQRINTFLSVQSPFIFPMWVKSGIRYLHTMQFCTCGFRETRRPNEITFARVL